jgi:H+-transporting ATPase
MDGETELLRASTQHAIDQLHSNGETGLSHTEAAARLDRHGHNEVAITKTSPLLRFAKKFWGLSAWMIELIIVLSWILHRYSDLYIVSALLMLNAILSFIQEQRASGVVDVLRSRLQVNARVLRASTWSMVPARDLVPGDIVRLRAGDFVPADIKILAGDLGVDQSTLTGESLETEKGADDTLFSGSIVRRGEATGIVVLTGAQTYYGRTTELVQMARPKLHVEEVVTQVVRWLFVIVGSLLAVALVYSLVRRVPLLEMLPLMLVLLLGAVPVALPVMFTVSMAVGSMQLAKKGVLVTRLSASDDAATMDVLCVDKTGTITTNRLAVTSVVPLGGSSDEDVLRYGALASQEANQDPIDVAFIAAAKRRGVLQPGSTQVSFAPFDARTRRTEAMVQVNGHEMALMKGAVQVIAGACGLGTEEIAALEARTSELAHKGHRTLAVAAAEAHATPRLVGLVTLSDAPRPDSAKLVSELRALGVAVKMLTGDALPIAREIARSVGLGESVSRVADLERLAGADMAKAGEVAEQSDGLAEIYPEGKYTVVKSLQARGHVVGMTGDGVNDAPALRQAEVGIAVSSATDVAKGAASVVLTDQGMGGIVDLVKNGRMIYQRIATWVINKVSRTILKTAFVVFAFLITGKLVVSAFAMILMMFMTDFVKISLSTDNVKWSQTPEKWDMMGLVKVAVVTGLLMVVEAFTLLYVGFARFGLGTNDQALYTFSFEILFYFAMFSIFAVRERGHFWDSLPSKTMLLAIGADLMLGTALATFGIPGLRPLPIGVTAFVIVFSLLFSLVINDTIKWLVFRRSRVQW